MLGIHTLGSLSIRDGDKEITSIGSRKAEAILVYLAIEGGVHNRHSLAALFWPESPESKALTSLRVALSSLRKSVGENLEISQYMVGMKQGARIYLDVFDLETKLAQRQIDQAIDIYRGDFLQGFHVQGTIDFEDWQLWEGERIRKILVSALQNAISNEIEFGNYKRGQELILHLLKLDNLNEFAHHQYMLAFTLDGQRNAALTHYKEYKQNLMDELGVEPSWEVKNLYQQITQEEITVQPKQFLSKHNLPTQQTSFVGREQEVDQLIQLLKKPSCKLLTLVGPGGFGKTRLALRVAFETWQDFQDGAYFVPLEKVTSVMYLIPAIAKAIQFNLDDHISETDPIDQLMDFLSQRSILIILDGYEHLIPDIRVVDLLLQHCPHLKILVTSRQKLNLQSEFSFPIQGLYLQEKNEGKPVEFTDSLLLFKDRAEQANTAFQLTQEELPHAVRICHLVEGMPLGIELAATWTSVLSSCEIADEIEKNLDFLETTMSDIPEKHRSLRAVFERSWQELTADQKCTLSKLSVFSGGFSRQSAQQITDARLSHLTDLYNKSLIRRDVGGRMDMHRSIKQFAAEKLAEIPDEFLITKEKHARYFLKILSDRDRILMGSGMVLARAEIRQDLENVRAALSWAITNWDQEFISRFINHFFVFLLVHGWNDGIIEVDIIISQIQDVVEIKPKRENPIILALEAQKAFLLSNLGRYEESEEICRDILEPIRTLRLKGELSVCIHNLGLNQIFIGEIKTAIELLSQAVDLGKESGYVTWPSYYLWLGYAYYLEGEYETGWQCLRRCYEVYDSWGSSWGSAFALSKMGLAADGLGQYETSMEYHQEALAIFEETGDRAGRAYCLSRMSTAAYFLEDYDHAVVFGLVGYQEFQKIGHRFGLYLSQCRLAFAHLGKDEIPQAANSLYLVLEDARVHEMVQLILYALAGLACAFLKIGEKHLGIRVFSFIKQHPKTPPLYIDLAHRWFHDFDQELVEKSEPFDELDMPGLIDDVVMAKYKLLLRDGDG